MGERFGLLTHIVAMESGSFVHADGRKTSLGEFSHATQSNMRSFAVDHQPTGRVGPFNAPTKMLLFMYQIPVCCVPTKFWSK